MTAALVDSNVVYGAFHRRDQYHDEALAIVRAADRGELPELVLVDFVLVEVMNGLTNVIAHEETETALDMLEESVGFRVERTPDRTWFRGIAVYREEGHLSLADAILVAHARDRDVEFVYSFDTGFDSVDGVRRLVTPDDPFEPG